MNRKDRLSAQQQAESVNLLLILFSSLRDACFSLSITDPCSPLFKEKTTNRADRGPQTTEDGGSGTNETIMLVLIEYPVAQIVLIPPSFSVRSSIPSGVVDEDCAFDLDDDPRRIIDARTSGQGSFTSTSVLELQSLPRLTRVISFRRLPLLIFMHRRHNLR